MFTQWPMPITILHGWYQYFCNPLFNLQCLNLDLFFLFKLSENFLWYRLTPFVFLLYDVDLSISKRGLYGQRDGRKDNVIDAARFSNLLKIIWGWYLYFNYLLKFATLQQHMHSELYSMNMIVAICLLLLKPC